MTNFFGGINKFILIILIISSIYIYFDSRNNNNSYLNSLFWAFTAMFVFPPVGIGIYFYYKKKYWL
jgi:hypothetical protein